MPVYVLLDTSVITEVFQIPGAWDAAFSHRAVDRLSRCNRDGWRFVVPVPVILEVGNHIARIPDGNVRQNRANRWRDAVAQSLETTTPFLIPLTASDQVWSRMDLYQWCHEFADVQAATGVSLTDTVVVFEARRLRAQSPASPVHIWTRDQRLKAQEPCPESDPL